MILNKLIQNLKYQVVKGSINIDILKIAYDSRRVSDGTLFVCIKGFKTDGHNYIHEAIEKGAIAIIVDRDVSNIPSDIVVIKVDNSRKALQKISNTFYDFASSNFNLIGITGTNGKTSVSYFISSVLERLNYDVGVIGTLGNKVKKQYLTLERTTPTTPESLDLQEIFSIMKDENVSNVVMEVSSMALEMDRVDDCQFDIGIFTNLTPDHLDDHKTMENYKNAKLKLFHLCPKAVVNVDDPIAKEVISINPSNSITYGIDYPADFQASNLNLHANGVEFELMHNNANYHVEINVPGRFSVYNALATISTCHLLGVEMNEILDCIKTLTDVPGRFQKITSSKGVTIIVDYAHSPDALENVLNTINEFSTNNIITVFGCGGDRDNSKRAVMGEIAGRLSTHCILTSDNPRNEDPLKILQEIEEGVERSTSSYQKIEDRRRAIEVAIKKAEQGDIVLIAGKGHETYQIIKNKTTHFNDMEVVNEILSLQEVNQ